MEEARQVALGLQRPGAMQVLSFLSLCDRSSRSYRMGEANSQAALLLRRQLKGDCAALGASSCYMLPKMPGMI